MEAGRSFGMLASIHYEAVRADAFEFRVEMRPGYYSASNFIVRNGTLAPSLLAVAGRGGN
jgi:hypothetical protein